MSKFRMVHIHKGPGNHSKKLGGWGHRLYCAGLVNVIVPKGHLSHSNYECATCIKCLQKYQDELDFKGRKVEEEIEFQTGKFLERQKKEIRKVKVPMTVYREVEVTL